MKQKILFLLLPALLLASCSSDDGMTSGPGEHSGGRIKFEIGFAGEGGLQSKAATGADFKTMWETGDEIGIFAVKHGEPLVASGNSIHNMKITYNGTSWNGAYWPNDENKNQNLDFYAYYPYDASATDPTAYTFSVMADQNDATNSKPNYNLSDLMTAKASDQSKGAAVSLQFSHALSLVQVEVKREPNMPHFDENDFTVTLTGALPGATLSWTSAPTGTGAATNIVMHKVEGMDYTYRALVPAQTLAADSKVTFVQTTTDKEINMEYRGIASAALTAAKAHKYSVTLGWGIDPDHAYAVGDVYPHVGPVMGIVYWLDNPSNDKSKHGKVVGLQENTGVAWADLSNLDAGGNADNMADGLVNMRAIARYIAAESKSWSNFPAFAWVHNLNDASEDYSDANATGVWYLPAKDELQYLYCAWNGKPPVAWSSPLPGWRADDNARTQFNSKLTTSGGAGLDNNYNTYYWSSSSKDTYNVYSTGFSSGLTTSGGKSNAYGRARCVLAF